MKKNGQNEAQIQKFIYNDTFASDDVSQIGIQYNDAILGVRQIKNSVFVNQESHRALLGQQIMFNDPYAANTTRPRVNCKNEITYDMVSVKQEHNLPNNKKLNSEDES